MLSQINQLEQQIGAVFPELGLSGYSAEDLFFTDKLLADCRLALATLAQQQPCRYALWALPWRLPDGRLNCAALLGGGKLLGMVPKSSAQPNYGEFTTNVGSCRHQHK